MFEQTIIYETPYTKEEVKQRMLSETILRSKYRIDSLYPDQQFQGSVDDDGFDVTWIRKAGLRGTDAIFTGRFEPSEKGTTVSIAVHMVPLAKLVLLVMPVLVAITVLMMLFGNIPMGIIGRIFSSAFFVAFGYLFYWAADWTYQRQILQAKEVFDRLFQSSM